MQRRVLAIVVPCLALLVACGSGQTSSSRLRVGYTNTGSFLGLFVARDQKLFEKHGLDVELVLVALNSTVPAALVGGSIQLGGMSPPVMLQAVDGGIDVVAVAGVAVNDIRNKTGSGVLARFGVDIKKPADFIGKRVGVPGIGAFMHIMFRRWLQEHGVDYKLVNFVEVPLAQGADALRAGNVDAVLLSEPFFSRVVKSNSGYLVAPYLSDMRDQVFSMYLDSSREWAMKNPDTITRFRAALAEANEFVDREPVKAREILAAATKLPADVVATSVLPTLKLDVPPGDVEYWSETMVSQGMLKTRPDPSRLIIH